MITNSDDPLQVEADCRQASCRFDTKSLQADTAGQYAITLPRTLDSAVPKRKAEFIAGRYCARLALAQLDAAAAMAEIGVGAQREPLWPPGFVGSITHTQGYASAVVARRTEVRALGIDSEAWVDAAVAEQISRHILTPQETWAGHGQLFESPRHYLTLVFSAKESLYKCLFPLVGEFFGFHAAVIIPQQSQSAAHGTFRFELLENLNAEFGKGYSGYGHYSSSADFVHTAIVLRST